MQSTRDPLVRHLAIAVALKVALLFVLWWAFVRDERVGVDIERAAAHVGVPGVPGATRHPHALPTSPSGAQP